MNRRDFVKAGLAGAALAAWPRWTLASEARRPNVVVILTDDLGYGDLSVFGCRDIATPHLDALLQRGVLCRNGYVAASICAPSRSALLTGRQPHRLGLTANHQPLPLGERTLAEEFKANGYATACFGKWHLSGEGKAGKNEAALHPTKRGFDVFEGGMGHSVNTTPDKVAADVEKGLTFLRRREKPAFVYLALGATHTPLTTDEAYLKRVNPKITGGRREYAASVLGLDDGIAKFIAGMDAAKLWGNTLVWFINDNGAKLTEGGGSGPFRDGKYSLCEGGIRVPFAVIWDGHLPARTTFDGLISALDVFPTSLAAAGLPVPAERPLDGLNLWPALSGQEKPDPERVLYWHGMRECGSPTMGVVRQGRWKLINPALGQTAKGITMELYDLDADPGEAKNVAADHPNVVRALTEVMTQHNARLGKKS